LGSLTGVYSRISSCPKKVGVTFGCTHLSSRFKITAKRIDYGLFKAKLPWMIQNNVGIRVEWLHKVLTNLFSSFVASSIS
jgi:hypothetical protein